MKSNIRRTIALLLVLSLLLGLLAACGSETAAATMHLRRTQGKVSVSDDAGKDVETARNLGLYSGYQVKTNSDSYAWIDLDEVKLAKLDESSKIEITKEGKRLEIEVRSGGLFFNVTEPLEDDETMEIRASSMVVGIRGTCGWVTLSEDKDAFQLWLLEGRVLCEAGDAEQTVQAGETAVMTRDGEITVYGFSDQDIPAFVQEELEEDDPSPAGEDGDGSSSGSWPTVPGFAPQSGETPEAVELWQETYIALLEQLEDTAKRYYLYDIDKDGTPELIAAYFDSYFSDDSTQIQVYAFQDGQITALSDPIDFPCYEVDSDTRGNGVLFRSGLDNGVFTLSHGLIAPNGEFTIEELGLYRSEYDGTPAAYINVYALGTEPLSWFGPSDHNHILSYTPPD